jgi:hypothetical protein
MAEPTGTIISMIAPVTLALSHYMQWLDSPAGRQRVGWVR